MAEQQDQGRAFRRVYKRELKNTKFNFPAGNIGIFMQVTLAIIYMYLIFIGYSMMGTTGLVFVSTLFLLALLSPVFYQVGRGLLRNRKAPAVDQNHQLQPEAEQEG